MQPLSSAIRRVFELANEVLDKLSVPAGFEESMQRLLDTSVRISKLREELKSTSALRRRRRKELEKNIRDFEENAEDLARHLLDESERIIISEVNELKAFAGKFIDVLSEGSKRAIQELSERPPIGDLEMRAEQDLRNLRALYNAYNLVKNDIKTWISKNRDFLSDEVHLVRELSEILSLGHDVSEEAVNRLKGLIEELDKSSKIDIATLESVGSDARKIIDELKRRISNFARAIRQELTSWNDKISEISSKIGADGLRVPPHPQLVANSPDTYSDIGSYLRDALSDARALSRYESELKRIILDRILSIHKRNRVLYETFRKYVEVESLKLSYTLKEPPGPDSRLDELYAVFEGLRGEEEYLSKVGARAFSSLKSELQSKILRLSTQMNLAREHDVEIPDEISTRLETLSAHLERVKDVEDILTLEKEISLVEGGLRDAVRNYALEERGRLLSMISGIPSLAEPPEITGTTVEEFIRGLHSLRRWASDAIHTLKMEIEGIIAEMRRGLDTLKGTEWYDEEVEREVNSLTAHLEEIKSFEDAVETYRRARSLLKNASEKLLMIIDSMRRDFLEVLKIAEELSAEMPITVVVPSITEIKASYSEIAKMIIDLSKKVEQRDKVLRDTLIENLNRIRDKIEGVPQRYFEFFKPLLEVIDDCIKKLSQAKTVIEIRELYTRTIKDLSRALQESFSAMKSNVLLKVRMVCLKLRNPPDLSESFEAINRTSVEQWELPSAVYEIDTIYRKKILPVLRDRVISEAEKYVKMLEGLKAYGIDVHEFLVSINETLRSVKEKEMIDAQDLSKACEKINKIVTDKKLRSVITEWAKSMVSALERSHPYISEYEEVSPEFAHRFADAISEIRHQVNMFDSMDMERISEVVSEINDFWNVTRSFILEIEERKSKELEEELRKMPYYDTVTGVYNANRKIFDEKIFPLSKIQEIKEKIRETQGPEVLELIREKRELEEEWGKKVPEIITWHKAVRVFLSGVGILDSEEVKERRMQEIFEKIDRIFKREDVRTYLKLAIRTLLGGR